MPSHFIISNLSASKTHNIVLTISTVKITEVAVITRTTLIITFILTSLWPCRLVAPSPLLDVCLKENMTLADRMYNLQLIQDFCKDNLNSCCHFSLEDMLYTSSTIKVLLKPAACLISKGRYSLLHLHKSVYFRTLASVVKLFEFNDN